MVFDGVLLAFAGDERLAPRTVGLRAPDLGLGPVEPQLNALRLGVGEDVLQRLQPQAGPVGHSETTGCRQRADLADGRGDGGAIHLEELGEHHMRQLMAQMDQGDQQPIEEDQLGLSAGTLRPPTLPAPGLAERGLPRSLPCRGEFGEQLAGMCA